jgi:hypothetical protein
MPRDRVARRADTPQRPVALSLRERKRPPALRAKSRVARCALATLLRSERATNSLDGHQRRHGLAPSVNYEYRPTTSNADRHDVWPVWQLFRGSGNFSGSHATFRRVVQVMQEKGCPPARLARHRQCVCKTGKAQAIHPRRCHQRSAWEPANRWRASRLVSHNWLETGRLCAATGVPCPWHASRPGAATQGLATGANPRWHRRRGAPGRFRQPLPVRPTTLASAGTLAEFARMRGAWSQTRILAIAATAESCTVI